MGESDRRVEQGSDTTGGARLTAEQLRQMADALPHLVWTCLADGPCDYLSRQWVEYTGVEEAEQVGYGWIAQLHPDDRERVKAEWAATVGHGAAFDLEFRIRRADGAHRWFRTRAIPLRDPSGTVVKWYGSNTDIDDFRKTEESLRLSEERFRQAITSAPIPMIIHDEDDCILAMSEGWTRLSGYTLDDIPTIGDWTERAYGERQAFMKDYIDKLFAIDKTVCNGEFAIRTKAGGERIWDFFTTPLGPTRADARRLLLSLAVDQTDRKRQEAALRASEARFRRLSEAGILGIIVSDLQGNVREVNQAVLDLLGCSREEIMSGEVRWRDLTPPERRARDVQAIEELRTSGVATPYEKEYIRKDGSRVPILIGVAMLDKTECIAFVLDISERKRAEQAVQQINEELERRVASRTAELSVANRELEAFSYSVAHDLRAPLRGMSGFARLLLDDHASQLDADGMDCLHEIQTNARKMAELIDALLALSRLTRSELKPAHVDLTALARDIARQHARAEPRRDVEVVVEEGMACVIDPHLARSLLDNLLANAWKFTKNAARPRIEVGGGVAADGGAATTFFVRDNGAGFDMTYADKLFAPFQRLHSAAEYPGTGVGLATVQRIIHRHRGRVWAESRVGNGATVYFTIPNAQGRTP